jgi:hypothetical protein
MAFDRFDGFPEVDEHAAFCLLDLEDVLHELLLYFLRLGKSVWFEMSVITYVDSGPCRKLTSATSVHSVDIFSLLLLIRVAFEARRLRSGVGIRSVAGIRFFCKVILFSTTMIVPVGNVWRFSVRASAHRLTQRSFVRCRPSSSPDISPGQRPT